MFGSGGYVLRNSGVAILVNKMLGPSVNAAMSIGNSLSSEAAMLTGALNGAFTPVIASAFGEKNFDYMRSMAYRSCKFGLLFTLVFALPLAIEIKEVLRLWLKDPPPFTSELSLCLLACVVIEKATIGHGMAVNASGIIAKYQCVHGFCLMSALPVGFFSLALVRTIWSVGLVLVATMTVTILLDVGLARRAVGLSAWIWIKTIVLPIGVLSAASAIVGFIPSLVMPPSFLRVAITTFSTILVFCPLVWLIVLSVDERMFLRQKMHGLFHLKKG